MNLDELLVFVRVVDAGSLTGAARLLGIPKSTVSRRLARLEERLGSRLLQRTTRSLRPTESGRALYDRCARLLGELEEAEGAVRRQQTVPGGRLRVTAPVEFGMTFMGALSAEFLTAHPQVSLEVVLTERVVDVVDEGYDLAIRIGPLPDSSLVGQRIDRVQRALYAAPAYLAARGRPASPEALSRHGCLTFFAESPTRWAFVGSRGELVTVDVRGRLAVNNLGVLRQAAEAGLGIANLPHFVCTESVRAGRLVRLLPEWGVAPAEIYAVYPTRRHLTPALQAYLALMRHRLADAPWNGGTGGRTAGAEVGVADAGDGGAARSRQ